MTEKLPAPRERFPVLNESVWEHHISQGGPPERQKGKDATRIQKYRTSKYLAERVAWSFVEENRGSLNFDLVTICPPLAGRVTTYGFLPKLTGSVGFRPVYQPGLLRWGP